MIRPAPPRDPWKNAPVGELQEQLLPRWFVILALVSVPVAIVTLVAAFATFGSGDVPVAERRPPPAAGLTSAVGEIAVGDSDAVPYAAEDCPLVDGIRIAGEDADRAALSAGLDALCAADLDPTTAERIAAFAEDGGVVRFAVFEATGVDSTADLDGERILVNAKFSQTTPAWIAPLIAHDATLLALKPGEAESALTARRAEAAVCRSLFADALPSRACDDAAALVAAPDPIADLQEAGYR